MILGLLVLIQEEHALQPESSETIHNQKEWVSVIKRDFSDIYRTYTENTKKPQYHMEDGIDFYKSSARRFEDIKITENNHNAKKECKVTRAGLNYTGSITHTASGYECQPWVDQTPHKHDEGRFDNEFPDDNISSANNFCRNPYMDPKGPYCYTKYLYKKWEYCNIPMCSEPDAGIHSECKNDRLGREYRGKVSKTAAGYLCLPWTWFEFTSIDFPDDNIDEALNYCRNPNLGDLGPWCYYTQSGYDFQNCMIPMCSEVAPGINAECKYDSMGWEYQGKISKTIFGDSCLPWILYGYSSDDFPDASIDEALNHCRNPGNYSRAPWCFYAYDSTSNTNPHHEREYCLIPLCHKPIRKNHPECRHDREGWNYQGKISHTADGQLCLPWLIFRYHSDDFPDSMSYY